MPASRRVRRRFFPDQTGARNDFLERRNLPAIRWHRFPLPVDVFHLCPVIDAVDLDALRANQLADGTDQRAGVDQQTANADALLRVPDAPRDLFVDLQTAAG